MGELPSGCVANYQPDAHNRERTGETQFSVILPTEDPSDQDKIMVPSQVILDEDLVFVKLPSANAGKDSMMLDESYSYSKVLPDETHVDLSSLGFQVCSGEEPLSFEQNEEVEIPPEEEEKKRDGDTDELKRYK